MTSPILGQLTLFGLEAAAVVGLLLSLFHLRSRFGLAPLFIVIGTFQHLQVMLAMSVYVELFPGISVSPGSAVLFTSTLFAVLLVYIREDALETRRLIFGLFVANVAVAVLTSLFGLHLRHPATRNLLQLPEALFSTDLRLVVVGSAALLIDVVLIIVLYEAVSHVLPRSIFLRACTTMLAVSLFDSLIFVNGNFAYQEDLFSLLLSAVVGKSVTSFFFSWALAVYLRLFRRRELITELVAAENRDIFDLMTYRQKYRAMREQLQRDALTGLFNRGFFDEFLHLAVARARRAGNPISLLMIDADHFKQVNDRFGHREGDRVLRGIATTLSSCLRKGDVACRFGGEEFAVIAHHAGPDSAFGLAERIRAQIATELGDARQAAVAQPTVTIGVATCPHDASTVDSLIEIADRRLYRGKETGRNRVVGREPFAVQSVTPLAVRNSRK